MRLIYLSRWYARIWLLIALISALLRPVVLRSSGQLLQVVCQRAIDFRIQSRSQTTISNVTLFTIKVQYVIPKPKFYLDMHFLF